MRSVLKLMLALSLLGCAIATTGKYEAILNSWQGNDVSALIQKWGPPSSTYEMPDGRKQYTWYFDGGVVAMPVYGGGAYAVQRGCKTTFTVNRTNIIESWRYEGNACKAK